MDNGSINLWLLPGKNTMLLRNSQTYMERAYGNATIAGAYQAFAVLCAIGVLTLGAILANDRSGTSDGNWYAVLVGTTGFAILTTAMDYGSDARYITPLTISAGVIATFLGVALWTDDRGLLPSLLVLLQTLANSIQLGAIFNQVRPMKKTEECIELMVIPSHN